MAKNKTTPTSTDSVLIVRFSALGDVAMTIPVVYDVCRANAEMSFVMLTRKNCAPMFANPPANLTVVGVDLKNDHSGPLAMVGLLNKLRADYAITMVADLHDVLRTKILRTAARLRGLRTAKIDKERRAKQQIAAQGSANGAPRQLKTTFERYRQVFADLGLKPGSGTFANIFDDDTTTPRRDLSAIVGTKREGEKWIAFAPFAAHEAKVYPADLMKRLIDLVAAEPNTRLFFFGGGQSEETAIDSWIEGKENCTSLAGRKLGFGVELELLRQMDVMVSMDSANMHLASLTGLKVVSIWGATHPCFGFEGWGQSPDNRVETTIACRPCSVYGNLKCRRGDYECLRAIAPETVMNKINNILHN